MEDLKYHLEPCRICSRSGQRSMVLVVRSWRIWAPWRARDRWRELVECLQKRHNFEHLFLQHLNDLVRDSPKSVQRSCREVHVRVSCGYLTVQQGWRSGEVDCCPRSWGRRIRFEESREQLESRKQAFWCILRINQVLDSLTTVDPVPKIRKWLTKHIERHGSMLKTSVCRHLFTYLKIA